MSRGMVIRAARKIAVQNGIHDEGEENRCVGDDKGDPPPEIRATRMTAFRGTPRPFDRYGWPGGDKLVCAHTQALASSEGSNDESEDIAIKDSGRVADYSVASGSWPSQDSRPSLTRRTTIARDATLSTHHQPGMRS